jgi:hypothetical protein
MLPHHHPNPTIMRHSLPGLLTAALLAVLPGTTHAQFGVYDALARRFSDVSFYMHTGGLAPRPASLGADRLSAYGIEVLLEIGTVSRPAGPPRPPADSVAFTWTEMRVTTGTDGTDTVRTYTVRRAAAVQPTVPIWVFELGVGYGQITGFSSAVPGLEIRGAVRELPTVSLYAGYEPSGTYFALRSGFIRFQGLQAWDSEGRNFAGEAESFLAGAALGQALDLGGITIFAEAGYSLRPFPSIRWSGAQVPPMVPRGLNLHGWTLGGGIQFSLGTN